MPETKLKPCPFCGNTKLKIDSNGDGYDENGNMIYDTYDCPKCEQFYELDYEK